MASKTPYAKMTVIAPAEGGEPLDKPGQKEIAAVERKLKHPLPDGYKKFITHFGPGQIGRYFNIRGPGYGPKSDADLAALVKLFRDLRDTYAELYGDEELIDRCIPFADTIGGDIFVWDPSASTAKIGVEYAIYLLADDSEEARQVASNFESFVNDICLGPAFGELIGDPNYKPESTFQPFSR
jgi:hypothetical protein